METQPKQTPTTRREQANRELQVQKSPQNSKTSKNKLNVPSKFSKKQAQDYIKVHDSLNSFTNTPYSQAQQQHQSFTMALNLQQLTETVQQQSKEKEQLIDEISNLKQQIQKFSGSSNSDPQQVIKFHQKIQELNNMNMLNTELMLEKETKIQQLQLQIAEFNEKQKEELLKNQQNDTQLKEQLQQQVENLNNQLNTQMIQYDEITKQFNDKQQSEQNYVSMIQSQGSQISQLQNQLNKEQQLFQTQVVQKQNQILEQLQMIKNLEYQIQELKGKIRITIRIRPALQNKIVFNYPDKINYKKQLTYTTQGQKAADGRDRNQEVAIDFDRVFAAQEQQNEIFLEFQPLVGQIFDGYKICVFAYGQSGSGKTHTQYGNADCPGIMPQSLQYIFRQIETLSDKQFRLQIQFYEIYNDKVYDLLADQTIEKLKSSAVEINKTYDAPTCTVSIIKDVVVIQNLNTVEINTIDEAYDLIKVSQARRKTSATVLNDTSSRSHAIFSINLLQQVDGKEIKGSLTIVDLAGSEQIQNANVDQKRKEESIFINTSLSCLGKVFNSMKSNQSHTPFRESTLTKVLSEYFQGQNKVVMIVCVNESSECYQETTNSINFAQRIKGVCVKK